MEANTFENFQLGSILLYYNESGAQFVVRFCYKKLMHVNK